MLYVKIPQTFNEFGLKFCLQVLEFIGIIISIGYGIILRFLTPSKLSKDSIKYQDYETGCSCLYHFYVASLVTYLHTTCPSNA